MSELDFDPAYGEDAYNEVDRLEADDGVSVTTSQASMSERVCKIWWNGSTPYAIQGYLTTTVMECGALVVRATNGDELAFPAGQWKMMQTARVEDE